MNDTTTLPRPTGAPPLYAQDGKGYEAIVHAHYFVGPHDWLVTEYDPTEDIAFGWARLNGDRQNAELGYVSLVELETIRVPLVVSGPHGERPTQVGETGVELDAHWPEGVTISDAVVMLDKRQGRTGV